MGGKIDEPVIASQSASSTPEATQPRMALDAWSVSPGALALWLMIQLCCLAVALLHIPLAASYPPGERLAIEVLLAGQIGSAAILAPMLCRTAVTALLAAASVWPALLLAGAVEVRPLSPTILAAAAVTLWIAMLWAWSTAFAARAGGTITASVATLLAVGGPILTYLRAEFGADTALDTSTADGSLVATPMMLAWRLAERASVGWNVLLLWLAFLVAGLAMRFRRTIFRLPL
jgi:hypothetical protein